MKRVKPSLRGDWRLDEIQRLSNLERDPVEQTLQIRHQLAQVVAAALPPSAPDTHIDEVVQASGYSRFLIDGLRGEDHPWHRPKRPQSPRENG